MASGGTMPPAMTAAMTWNSPEARRPVPVTYAALLIGPPMSTAIMPPTMMPMKMRADGSMFFSVSTIQPFSAETGGASSDLEKRNRSLYSDLELYEKGIAPEKTGANLGVNAYNATFRIQDARGRFHLLTLTDLPGELIDEDTGAINTADMVDKFPTALSCDAYVICFDTSKKGKEQVQINATLQSADAVQKLEKLGYTNLYDLGGILSWPYELES